MSTARPSPRGRRERLGADAARVWARELVLGNPYAKSVLLAVANYMNEDGAAWPGIVTIARDTDIGEETVIKRLRWLEAIGAIALLKCWVDENGRRNHDARGRPTSSEIRFLFDADIDEIEQSAKEAVEPRALRGAALAAHTAKVSTRPHGELDTDQPSVSTPVAPDQLSTPADPHIEEKNLEPELEPPNPPSGGDHAHDLSESFKPFASNYPAPITDMGKALAIWSALSESERTQAIVGAKGYRSYIETERQSRRNRAVKDAHRWLRDRLWLGYLTAGQHAEATGRRFDARQGSDQWLAWMVFYRICGEAEGIPKFLITGPPGNRVASVPREWPPVGQGVDPNAVWQAVDDGTGQFAAWVRRLRELPGVKIQLRSNIVDGRSIRFLRVPSEWPPNKGSTGPPPTTITSNDREFIDKQGLG